eukprot:1711651-Rhodomonas_salina.1
MRTRSTTSSWAHLQLSFNCILLHSGHGLRNGRNSQRFRLVPLGASRTSTTITNTTTEFPRLPATIVLLLVLVLPRNSDGPTRPEPTGTSHRGTRPARAGRGVELPDPSQANLRNPLSSRKLPVNKDSNSYLLGGLGPRRRRLPVCYQ